MKDFNKYEWEITELETGNMVYGFSSVSNLQSLMYRLCKKAKSKLDYIGPIYILIKFAPTGDVLMDRLLEERSSLDDVFGESRALSNSERRAIKDSKGE